MAPNDHMKLAAITSEKNDLNIDMGSLLLIPDKSENFSLPQYCPLVLAPTTAAAIYTHRLIHRMNRLVS
jgi:hypothetical protein